MRNSTWIVAFVSSFGVLASGCAGSAPPPSSVAEPRGSSFEGKGAPESPAEPSGDGAPTTSSDASGELAAVNPSAPPPSAQASESELSRRSPSPKKDVAPEPTQRPGLGTTWGETRTSHITTVPFLRADSQNPFAVTTLFYNDAEGARAIANSSGFRRTSSGAFTSAGGAVTVGLRDQDGSFLSAFVAGERKYVIGEAGNRYTIVLRNHSNTRFEAVISVDGLDVLDGRSASFSKRGYLLDPGGELEVDGFRQSTNSVAAFRFGSVRGSYANQKHGETRNVGVIGVALFHERGSNPEIWTASEIDRRQNADPFPGQFASPPGR